MDASSLIAQLQPLVPEVTFVAAPASDAPTLVVPAAHIVETCRAMRDGLGYACLSDLTCADYWPREPRFEVVYQFVHLEAPARARLKVALPGEAPQVPTISEVFANANWAEREVFDLFGVTFLGHPDPRRILLPDEWEGHPLRKDYPVQVNVPVRVMEPLQVTEEEFIANIQRQRNVLSKRS
jgi:NADH-quinone oxidoreductase subunit C